MCLDLISCETVYLLNFKAHQTENKLETLSPDFPLLWLIFYRIAEIQDLIKTQILNQKYQSKSSLDSN